VRGPVLLGALVAAALGWWLFLRPRPDATASVAGIAFDVRVPCQLGDAGCVPAGVKTAPDVPPGTGPEVAEAIRRSNAAIEADQ